MTGIRLPRDQDSTDLARAVSVESPETGAPDLWEFRECASRKYTELDEDLVAIIEDLIEREKERVKLGKWGGLSCSLFIANEASLNNAVLHLWEMRTLLEGDQISTPEESVGIKRRKFVRSQTQGGGRQGMSGVTLIEILIIIAILGVLAAVVIPNLSRLLGQ